MSESVPTYEQLHLQLAGLRVKHTRLTEVNEQLANTAAKEIAEREQKIEKLQTHVTRLNDQLAERDAKLERLQGIVYRLNSER